MPKPGAKLRDVSVDHLRHFIESFLNGLVAQGVRGLKLETKDMLLDCARTVRLTSACSERGLILGAQVTNCSAKWHSTEHDAP
jgi:hypothetical protein